MSTLACRHARIEEEEHPLVDGLDCEATAERVGLVGDWAFLFRLLVGEATLTGGTVTIGGSDARTAVRNNAVGVAPNDVPLPDAWTATEYLERGAALMGLPKRAGRLVAARTLDTLGVTSLGPRKIRTLQAPERRALVLAQAALGAPSVLAVDRALDELDDDAADYVALALERAAEGRRLILSVGSFSPLSPSDRVLRSTGEVLLLAHGVVHRSHPAALLAPGRRYLITTIGAADGFVDALEDRGIVVDTTSRTAASDAPLVDHLRLLVQLPDGSTTEPIVDAAVALGVAVVEMLPLQTGPALRGVAGGHGRPGES